MDDTVLEDIQCQSLTHGDVPTFTCYKSIDEEISEIVVSIKELLNAGMEPKNICIVARTHKLINEYSSLLSRSGYRVYEIKRSKTDDLTFDGIRVATMHRVKGLEFSYVFVVGLNRNIMPLSAAINHTDIPSEEESIVSEKCLLYVALTRAQKKVYLSGYGSPSELFLQ